ncbi:MAG: RNA polymerase sigma factor [Hyphomicrobiales bacterium]
MPPLTLVKGGGSGEEASIGQGGVPVRDIDWSILMARAQSGDGAAYRRLLEEATPYLRSLAGRRHRDASDVEDAVQDVLLTLHAIRNTYDPARPFGPWLVAIANRRFVDRLRRQGRRRSREAELTAEHETFQAPQTNVEQISDRARLEEAVEKLPPGQRQAIRLLKLKEMSLKEAATVSGMSIASLKIATHRALRNLRKMLSTGSDA